MMWNVAWIELVTWRQAYPIRKCYFTPKRVTKFFGDNHGSVRILEVACLFYSNNVEAAVRENYPEEHYQSIICLLSFSSFSSLTHWMNRIFIELIDKTRNYSKNKLQRGHWGYGDRLRITTIFFSLFLLSGCLALNWEIENNNERKKRSG